jgi:hypothetical protein
MEKVVWIVGASFSGSSLLNLLLDTQPTVRGLGEGSQVYRRGTWGKRNVVHVSGGPCALCRSTVDECGLYKNYHGEPFYRFNFDHYGCNLLVDSSKSVDMFCVKPREAEFGYTIVLISKSPPEAVQSPRLHAKWDHWDAHAKQVASVEHALSFYIATYRDYLLELAQLKMSAPIVCVQYAQLARNPMRSIERLCNVVDEPFDTQRLADRWWETDTHVLGGNPAVVAQIAQDDSLAFAVPRDRYLDGKYDKREGQIFYDASWQRDLGFLEACFIAMNERRSELCELLPRLGYDFDSLMEEIKLFKCALSS